MGKRVLVVGGSGLLGEPVVRRLVESDAEVTVATRGNVPLAGELGAEVRFEKIDRGVAGAVEAAAGDGVDALVDVVPYHAEDASQVLRLEGRVGTIVVVSSASVYADNEGRPLLEGPHESDRPVPFRESQPTVAPDEQSYSGQKAAIEGLLLRQTKIPATLLRPGAIYGEQDRSSREWYFVKRVLDRRDKVVLADNGASRFHQVAAENVAELVRLAVEKPGTRVLNAGDEEPRTVAQIGSAVAKLMGHEWQQVLFPGPPTASGVGDTPWTTLKPFVLDMMAARDELGYRDVISYEDALRRACEWLDETVDPEQWQVVLPKAARYYGGLFDYEAEDKFVIEGKWS
jgi:nucleoside-diphosphate-sugar epimerase